MRHEWTRTYLGPVFWRCVNCDACGTSLAEPPPLCYVSRWGLALSPDLAAYNLPEIYSCDEYSVISVLES